MLVWEIRSVFLLSVIQGIKISSIWNLTCGQVMKCFVSDSRLSFFDRHDILLPLHIYTPFRCIIKIVTEIRLGVIISCVDVILVPYIWFIFCLFYKLVEIILTIHCKIKSIVFPSTWVCSVFPNTGHYFATIISWLVL